MTRAEDPRIGERIRAERTKRGISLRSLARSAEVSGSLISQIETGKCQPSVSTLLAITTTLGVSIQDFFPPTDAPPAGLLTAAAPGAECSASAPPSPPALTPAEALTALRRSSPVFCAGEREVLLLDSGVTWERLGHVPRVQVDFMLVTYAPGATSSAVGLLMQHPGAEYAYLLEGELILTLGDEEQHLTAGQSVSFASSTPHRYRNDAPRSAVGVCLLSG